MVAVETPRGRIEVMQQEMRMTRGALSFSVGAGAHKLRFQGRISKHKRLLLGRYTLIITATNAAGQHATARLTFTIVR
jgi:hypothetical protein